MTSRELTNEILSRYSVDQCKEKWIEELLELALKLQQTKFKKIPYDEIVEEIADVYIVLDQMDKVYGNYPIFNKIREKQKEIRRRIDGLGLICD